MQNTLLLVLGSIFSGVLAQLPHTGECPARTPVQAIDARKLSSGVWYENQRTASLTEWPFKCFAFKVLQPFFEHKSTLKVTSIHRFNGHLSKLSLPLKSVDPEGRNGKMVVTIPAGMQSEIKTQADPNEVNNTKTETDFPAQILAMGSNSTNWGVVWSCRYFEKAKLHTESVWVITRDREVDDKTFDEIREALTSLNLEHLVMRDSMQNDCSMEDGKVDADN